MINSFTTSRCIYMSLVLFNASFTSCQVLIESIANSYSDMRGFLQLLSIVNTELAH